jgi:hypothetical protein
MKSTKRAAAYSLLEVTVAMFLTGIMLLCTQQLLAAAARYYKNSQMCLELQEGLLAGCTRAQVEIAESNYASIVVDPGPPAGVVFITPRRFDGGVTVTNGKAEWRRMVCFYSQDVNGTPCLVWKERGIPAVTVPPYPAVPAPWDKVSRWASWAAQPPHIVARNVTDFTVTDTTPLLLQMTASDPSGRYVFVVEARVHPKN